MIDWMIIRTEVAARKLRLWSLIDKARPEKMAASIKEVRGTRYEARFIFILANKDFDLFDLSVERGIDLETSSG